MLRTTHGKRVSAIDVILASGIHKNYVHSVVARTKKPLEAAGHTCQYERIGGRGVATATYDAAGARALCTLMPKMRLQSSVNARLERQIKTRLVSNQALKHVSVQVSIETLSNQPLQNVSNQALKHVSNQVVDTSRIKSDATSREGVPCHACCPFGA